MTAPRQTTLAAQAPCPCDLGSTRGTRYGACCGRWHAAWAQALAGTPGTPDGGADGAPHRACESPPDAASLMRSRYSAYVLGLHGYLRATWAPETCPPDLEDPAGTPAGLKWLGLEVRQQALHDADHASVEFVARSKLGGRAHRLHELSRFERRGGRWVYVDGEMR